MSQIIPPMEEMREAMDEFMASNDVVPPAGGWPEDADYEDPEFDEDDDPDVNPK